MTTAIRIEEGLLRVPLAARLPKVCLLCGATKSIRRRPHLYTVGSNANAAMGGVGGVVGAMTAQTMRHLGHAVAAGIFVSVVGGAAVIGYFVQRMAQKVEVALPLCERCDDRWTDGETKRVWVYLGLGITLALAPLGYAIDSLPVMGSALAVFIITLAFAWMAELRTRFAQVAWTRTDAIAFKLPTEIAEKVLARAEKRAARQASDDKANDAEPDEAVTEE